MRHNKFYPNESEWNATRKRQDVDVGLVTFPGWDLNETYGEGALRDLDDPFDASPWWTPQHAGAVVGRAGAISRSASDDDPRELFLDGREAIRDRLHEARLEEMDRVYDREPTWRSRADYPPLTTDQREKLRVYVNIERAGGNLKVDTWERIRAVFEGCCAYCGEPPRKDNPIVMDHVVPVARGGTTVDFNVVPACQCCNASKHAKRPEEWMSDYDFERFLDRWPFASSYEPTGVDLG